LLTGTCVRCAHTGTEISKARHRGAGRRGRKNSARRIRYLRLQARRLGRRFRYGRRAASLRLWWEERRLEFGTLEHDLPPEYEHIERVQIGSALVYRGEIDLDPLGVRRRLTLIFPGPPSTTRPIVMASGPTRSRHRFRTFRPTSLCLWYAPDHRELKWRLEDGLTGLIDLARRHLVQEAWWRETGTWDGPEVHREPTPNSGGAVARKRLERVRCWCGSGRAYRACHGAIPPELELQLLGLTDEPAIAQDRAAA
jgi:hypothetical protein